MIVEVITTSNCMSCRATKRALDREGIPFVETRADEATEAAVSALNRTRDLGYAQAPVVLVESEAGVLERHWTGYRPDEIKKLKEGPHAETV